ncbi:MAG: hypothetical protein J2P28_21950 [Actinobacteria bacterium]|nr:hypothetical protein [Actinomycetota bacterium]
MAKQVVVAFPAWYRVRSLIWARDRLLDPVGGEASVGLDGSVTPGSVNWTYEFDQALASDDGETTVLYTALGTKGLVVRGRREVREINRSYYHASVYEYPITVGRLHDGTDVLIHCPDGYNRLAIETLADGKRLASATDQAADLFHSRLRLSPDGRRLLTAGWFWHPYGVVAIYDLMHAREDPTALDHGDTSHEPAVHAEVESACWLTSDQVVLSTSPEEEPLRDSDSTALGPGELGVWSISQRQWIARSTSGGHTGTLHAIGRHVLALYEHPRLLDPVTGAVIDAWPGLATGTQTSSILVDDGLAPAVAVDAANGRFAVASNNVVTVIQLPSAAT